MRKVRIAGVVLLVISTVAMLATPAQAATRHVHAFAPYSKSTDVRNDQDPAGPSVGDSHSGNFKMFNHGKRVGHFDYTCVTTSMGPQREECHATATFTGRGTITVMGSDASNAQDFRVAITGGTGDFNGAKGNARLSFGRHGGHFRFNIK